MNRRKQTNRNAGYLLTIRKHKRFHCSVFYNEQIYEPRTSGAAGLWNGPLKPKLVPLEMYLVKHEICDLGHAIGPIWLKMVPEQDLAFRYGMRLLRSEVGSSGLVGSPLSP